MALTYDEFMKNLENKKVEVSEGGDSSPYQDAVATIKKVQIVKKGMAIHPLLDAVQDAEQPFLFVTLHLEIDQDGTTKIIKDHFECGGLLTRAGDLAVYPTSKDGKFAGTLLYDLVHLCKEYDEDQKAALSGDWQNNLLTIFDGFKFNIRAKVLGSKKGGQFVILETSRQKARDTKYAKSQAKAEENIVDPSDLPF